MRIPILALVLLNLTFWTLPVQAQSWSGIINPSRAIDWSQAGVPGGIPTTRTNCVTAACVDLAPGGTGTVSTATINAAIAGAPANTVVRIRAGTFTLTGGLTMSTNNVTLRGAGPDQTTLTMTGTVNCLGYGGGSSICVQGADARLGLGSAGAWSTSWSGPYTQGTTQLTVASSASMVAGRIAVLDQLDDTTDNGGIIQAWTTGFCQDCFTPPARQLGTEGGRRRPQNQIVKIVSVDSPTQVTITPGVYMPNWRAGQSPQIWGWGTTNASTVVGVGIENLTLNNTSSGAGRQGVVMFASAYGSWMKNVRSLYAHRSHVQFNQSAHIEIRDCFFYGAFSHAAESYGVDSVYTGDNLVVNSIFHWTVAAFLGPSHGSVIAYNYTIDNQFYSTVTWSGIWNTHDAGGGMTLAEGNQTPGYVADNSAGNSPLGTMFRNHFSGIDDCVILGCADGGTKTLYRQPIKLKSWGRAYNAVGNVLGTSGAASTYQNTSETASSVIYLLGSSSTALDPITTSSLLRWGNYDTVNGATRWLSSEIPTNGITFINGNPVPATQTLPASFFLSARPSFWVTPWGTPAWPPIGPDVTGGNVSGVAGHVHDIPAKRCFNNMTNDSAYPSSNPRIKLFNATACYGGNPPSDSTSPLPPQNVTVR